MVQIKYNLKVHPVPRQIPILNDMAFCTLLDLG